MLSIENMKEYFKEYGSPLIFWAVIGGVAIAVGLLWPSFYWLVVGSIILLGSILFALFPFVVKNDSNESIGQSIGCSVFLLLVLVTLLNIVFNGTRYISSDDNRQHRYSNCEAIIMSKHIIEVSRLEGFFHLYFKDCENCEQRRTSEKKQRRANEKIKELQEEITELQEEIEVKEWQIKALRNGADIDDIDFGEEDEEEYYDEHEIEPVHMR